MPGSSRSRRRPPPRKGRYHHGDLPRALLDATLQVIAEVGPEALSVRDVARRAGVSPAAPYRHFADKEALVAAVAAECAQRLRALLDAAVAAAGEDPLRRLRDSGVAFVRFAVENPAHFRIMGLPGVRQRMPRPIAEELDAWYGAERDRLREAQRQGLLGDLPIEEMLIAATALVHGLAQLIINGDPLVGRVDVARAMDLALRTTAVLGRGVLPR